MVKSSSARSPGDNRSPTDNRGVGAYSRDYAKFDRPEDKVSARERIVDTDKTAPGNYEKGERYGVAPLTGKIDQGYFGKGPPRYAPKNKAPGALTNGNIADRFDLTKGRKR